MRQKKAICQDLVPIVSHFDSLWHILDSKNHISSDYSASHLFTCQSGILLNILLIFTSGHGIDFCSYKNYETKEGKQPKAPHSTALYHI